MVWRQGRERESERALGKERKERSRYLRRKRRDTRTETTKERVKKKRKYRTRQRRNEGAVRKGTTSRGDRGSRERGRIDEPYGRKTGRDEVR